MKATKFTFINDMCEFCARVAQLDEDEDDHQDDAGTL